MIPFFDIGAGLAEVGTELQAACQRVVESGCLIMGPETAAFEEEFAAYCGARFCIGVGNGLDALMLSLRARGVGPGDDVLVPSQTFIATWLAVSMVGATPVPVEIDPSTYNLDPTLIRSKTTKKTKAIVPVHLYGLPAAMEEINALAKERDLFVLEDAAQAHGASVGVRRTGALGDAAGFSFYPTKNLGAIGDGGAIVTNNEELAADVRMLRNYGSRKKYEHDVVGVNSRLDELQAAFLRIKLGKLDDWNRQRQILAARYSAGLEGVGDLQTPRVPAGHSHVFHLYVVASARRAELSAHLRARGIHTLIHYPRAPHAQGAYRNLGICSSDLALATAAAERCLSLPIWPRMKFEQVDQVIAEIVSFFS